MFSVRPMNFNDIDNVHGIETRSHIVPWSRDIVYDCLLVGYDCRVLQYSEGLTGKITGYIISRERYGIYHILNLCIDISFQRKCMGRFLLQNVLHSLEEPIQTIALEVRPTNQAAVSLYQSEGFEVDSIKPDYYNDKYGIEDAWVLKKSIKIQVYNGGR